LRPSRKAGCERKRGFISKDLQTTANCSASASAEMRRERLCARARSAGYLITSWCEKIGYEDCSNPLQLACEGTICRYVNNHLRPNSLRIQKHMQTTRRTLDNEGQDEVQGGPYDSSFLAFEISMLVLGRPE